MGQGALRRLIIVFYEDFREYCEDGIAISGYSE